MIRRLPSAFVSLTLPLLAGAFGLSPADAREEATPYYLHQGERIELETSLEVLSVGLHAGRSLEERRTLMLSSGALVVTARRLSNEVWRVDLAPVSSMSTTQARALRNDAISALLADPAVDWAYAALRRPSTGTLLLPTPRLIARTRGGVSEETLRAALPPGVELLGNLRGSADQYRLSLTDPRTDHPLPTSVELAGQASLFEWVEPDFVQQWRLDAIPNDALFPDQWHLRNTGQGGGTAGADSRVHQAWDVETGDGSIVIAVLDDGVQLLHPDLESRIFVNSGEIPSNGIDDDGNGYIDDVNGWDFSEEDNLPDPDLGDPVQGGPGSHGTSVAGVAAAAGDNSIGGVGACPNCSILPVRVAAPFFGTVIFVDNSVLAEAILYAGSLADVLNNSWGGGSPSSAIDDAIVQVTTQGRDGLGSPVLFSVGNAASGWQVRKWTFFGTETQTRVLEWSFDKDETNSEGFDSAWLDAVSLPDGTFEGFENCTVLPTGWQTGGDADWSVVDDGRRATSTFGGHCSIKAGEIADSQRSWLRVEQTFEPPASVFFSAWVSSEPAGIILTSGCLDGLTLNVYDTEGNLLASPLSQCGTWSNQFQELQDGTISYPASHPSVIAVGSATNFDLRSDYSQHGPELDFVAHSSGGTLDITTTDVTGIPGYDESDYTDGFGGTSAAAPHAAGIAALLLSREPGLTANEVGQRLRDATRKIGPVAYTNGRNDQYGHGALDASAVIAPAVVFSDGFESGDTSAWTIAVP